MLLMQIHIPLRHTFTGLEKINETFSDEKFIINSKEGYFFEKKETNLLSIYSQKNIERE